MSLAGEEIIFNSGYAGWKAQKDRQEHIDKLNRDIQIAKQKGYDKEYIQAMIANRNAFLRR